MGGAQVSPLRGAMRSPSCNRLRLALPRAALGSAVGAGGGLSRWGGERNNGIVWTDGTNGRQMRDGVCGEGRERRGEEAGQSLGV